MTIRSIAVPGPGAGLRERFDLLPFRRDRGYLLSPHVVANRIASNSDRSIEVRYHAAYGLWASISEPVDASVDTWEYWCVHVHSRRALRWTNENVVPSPAIPEIDERSIAWVRTDDGRAWHATKWYANVELFFQLHERETERADLIQLDRVLSGLQPASPAPPASPEPDEAAM